jgi:diguanylate cyclase (GGDEF)-like protein
MDSLLKHMVDMTGHRDHAMLDISVISAVQELAGASQTRVLNIATIGERRFLRSRASIGDGRCARTDEPVDSTHLGEPIEHFPELVACLENFAPSVEAVAENGCRTLWLPIWFGDKADTVLEILSDGPFVADTLHMVSGIVGVYRNFHSLLAYSERDSLTGLLNRKTFDDQLARMLQAVNDQNLLLPGQSERRHASEEEQQWLAVVDVDHFKSVNDRFGHLYGDEVLILIANLLTSSFRSQDRVFRFGGEEFVILLRWPMRTASSSASAPMSRRICFRKWAPSPSASASFRSARASRRWCRWATRTRRCTLPRAMAAIRYAITTSWSPMACCRRSRRMTRPSSFNKKPRSKNNGRICGRYVLEPRWPSRSKTSSDRHSTCSPTRAGRSCRRRRNPADATSRPAAV